MSELQVISNVLTRLNATSNGRVCDLAAEKRVVRLDHSVNDSRVQNLHMNPKIRISFEIQMQDVGIERSDNISDAY